MLFTIEATAEKNDSSVIQLGSGLSPKGDNTSWPSSSGHFAFGFYPHGNGFAVGIWLVSPSENTTTVVVWTANRDSPPVSSNSILNLTMQGLLLQNGKEDLPHNLDSRDSDSEPVASASIHDSGNFVLYDKHFNVLWQSFDLPTDTILGGQNLTSDRELVSSMSKSDHSSGRFKLSMQTDGNLVAYPSNSYGSDRDAYWASMTNGVNSTTQLSLNDEGSLCLFDSLLKCFSDRNKPGKKSQNTTSIYRATLEVDGNFVLYEHQIEGNTGTHVKMLWQALNDKCQIKGFCGLNSYCSNKSGNAVCECFPGFIPSMTKSSPYVPLNCVQTHSKDDCESSEDPIMLYNVTHFENMSWGDIPYSVMPMKKETCEKACREDCDCGGAFYTGGNCNKYRLPLIYGRIQIQIDSTLALLKIPSIVISPPPTSNKTDVPKPMVVVDNKRSLIMILGFTLGCISLFSLVFAVSVFFTYRRQLYKYTTLSESEKLGFTEEYSLRSFSYDELVKSTGGFTEEIGSGSFGAVYRGTVGDSNKRIAVKRLERIADEGEREFRAEITAIARTHHRNLVKLVGFCIDGSRKLLVYEYLSNGSLANLLFEGDMTRLSWKERIKIALDVARGLLYLHEECEVRIIHCNIKPQNILMDETWTAKISDFGLARLLKRDYSRMKNARDDGKSGYLAPEWQKDASVLSVKADIYSFGMVLLEIVCRRSSIDTNVSSANEILLSSWVYQCFAAGQLNKLIRHEEEEDVDWKILERMVKVGLWCVQYHPSLRPSMKNVILMLDGLKDIPAPPSSAPLVEI